MTANLDNFAQALASKPLYVPQRCFNECQRALKNSKRSLSVASEFIVQDPGLCMLVLRHVNRSRAKNRNSLEITSVVSAMNILGETAARQLIGRVEVLEHKIKNKKVNGAYRRLLDRMLHTSLFAGNWAEQRGDRTASEVRIAGLLHDIGELALCAHHHDLYSQVNRIAATEHISLAGASVRVLGFTLAQLSEQLAIAWSLPEVVLDAMQCKRYELYRPRGVMLAAECARLAQFGWYHQDIFVCKELLAEYLNTNIAQTCKHLHRAVLSIARQSCLHYPSSYAANLVQMPCEMRRKSPAAPPQKQAQPTVVAAASVQACEDNSKVKLQRAKVFAATVQKLKSCTAKPNASANDVVKSLLYGLHRGVGVERVAFAMFDPGGQGLSVKLAQGITATQAKNLNFPCRGHSLFASLMKSPKSLWINASNFVKFQPLIPERFSQQVMTDDFICTSLFCGRRPIGLVYTDRIGGAAPFDDRIFQHVKSLVLYAGKALTVIDNERRAAKAALLAKSEPRNRSERAASADKTEEKPPLSVKEMSDRLLQQRAQLATAARRR